MTSDKEQPNSVYNLIASLESATEGSRALDLQLAYCVGGAAAEESAAARLPAKWHALGDFPAIAKIMLEEGFSWQSVCDVLDCEAPAYTTSLDAALPGENIVFVIRSTKRERWGAIHKTSDGEEIQGWGATEVLARRTAALKGFRLAPVQTNETEVAATPGNFARSDVARIAAKDSSNRRIRVINGEDHELPLGKTLEGAFAEQEDREWEILF